MYWIAINQASCALCPIPSNTAPETRPRAELYVGFQTLAQAKEAQRMCLDDPIPVVRKAMARWNREGKIVPGVNPEPPQAATVWTIRKR